MNYQKAKSMNIEHLINSGQNIQVVVSALDLREAFEEWSARHKTEDWLPTSEVVGRYNVSKQTLTNYTKRGMLHSVRRGVELHYRLSELQQVFGE